ncbi:MAG: hypothetical protein RLZZ467_418, partial [Gemmatimonadota bacterium]
MTSHRASGKQASCTRGLRGLAFAASRLVQRHLAPGAGIG